MVRRAANSVTDLGTDSARHLYGMIALGGQNVAIEIEAIREVVPAPPCLLPFPATSPAVAGAIEVRGTLVPVIDPAALPGFPAPGETARDAPTIVTVLCHDGRMFGMLTHAILGVAELGAPASRPLGINGADGALLSASFIHGGWHGVVIDMAALSALPGLPHTPDSHQQQAALAGDTVPTLMFVAGDVHMAIAASLIDATLPDAAIDPAPVDDPLWIGMLPYKGRDVPLVDTLTLTGFAGRGGGPVTHGAAVMLRYPAPDGGLDYVALLISSVHDIVRLGPEALLPLTDAAIATTTMADALFAARGHVHMRLGEQALLNHPSLRTLAALRQTSATSIAQGPRQAATRRPFLIFTVGNATLAAPLDDVDEIIRTGIEALPLPHGGRSMRALAIHRGASVPLVDLGQRLGLAGGEAGFILLARHGERRQGFLVDALRSVERVEAQVLRSAGNVRGPAIPQMTVRIDRDTTCQVVDLPGMIAA
jgi:purine-binding chemotaxis protein CheW